MNFPCVSFKGSEIHISVPLNSDDINVRGHEVVKKSYELLLEIRKEYNLQNSSIRIQGKEILLTLIPREEIEPRDFICWYFRIFFILFLCNESLDNDYSFIPHRFKLNQSRNQSNKKNRKNRKKVQFISDNIQNRENKPSKKPQEEKL